jgi:hypothetical protein
MQAMVAGALRCPDLVWPHKAVRANGPSSGATRMVRFHRNCDMPALIEKRHRSLEIPKAMKTPLAILAAAMLMLAAPSAADAKGCIKGAVVGGVAGHYAGHHGVLGAAAGCLYGRHRANEQEKQQQQQSDANGRGKL